MKKFLAILICVAALLAVGVLCAAAVEPTQEASYWVVNAEKIDEILAGEAGEKSVGWEVPFLHIAPTIDGSISKNDTSPSRCTRTTCPGWRPWAMTPILT